MVSPQAVGALLPKLARDGGWAQVMELCALKEAWPELMGKAVAAHAVPTRLQHGRLTVTVDSSPWLTQLGFFKTEMRDKANRKLGVARVQEVFLVVGRVIPKGTAVRPKPAPKRALSAADLDEVEAVLAAMPDDAGKEAMRRLLLTDRRQGRGRD